MENKPEEAQPQKNEAVETPKVEEQPEVVEPKEETPEAPVAEESISKAELEDLRKKAEVSSQNFARLKKAEEELKKLKELEDKEVLPEYEDEEVSVLKEEIQSIKSKLSKAEVIERHPEMKEVWDEFEEFRADPENKGMNLNTAAKAFRIEKGIAEPRRKGLERSTGGDRVPIRSGMTSEEVAKLRKNDYKKYREMLKKDQIRIES